MVSSVPKAIPEKQGLKLTIGKPPNLMLVSPKGHSRKTRIETRVGRLDAHRPREVPKAIPEKQGLKPLNPDMALLPLLLSQRPFQKNKD